MKRRGVAFPKVRWRLIELGRKDARKVLAEAESSNETTN